jgi:hypothetical protein
MVHGEQTGILTGDMYQRGWRGLFERFEVARGVKLEYDLHGAQSFQININIPSIRVVKLEISFFTSVVQNF